METWSDTTVAETGAPPLALCLFGPLEVRLHGASLPHLRSRKGHWLLALLALRAGREVERSWLAGTLWPESIESQALSHLRKSLTDLRRALGLQAWRLRSPSAQTLALDLSGAAVDVLAFDGAIACHDEASLERAVRLYRGPLLEGCGEEWVFQERQAREQAYLGALEALAEQALASGDTSSATAHLRRAVAVDPLRESAQRGLMQALALSGNDAAALLSYRELRERLHRELNAQPDPETTALFQQLRAEAQRKAACGGRLPRHRKELGQPPDTSAADRLDQEPRAESAELPGGIVTFLFTDIEGSTRLWLEHPEAMRQALARHDTLLTGEIEGHGGIVLKQRGEGDSAFAVFRRATDAVAAALALQWALAVEPWPGEARLQVRVALHTGEAELREGDYYGLAVNHCARLRAVGHGGQTLLSQTTAALVRHALPEGVRLGDLGTHRLKDLQRAEPIFQMMHPELPAVTPAPPLRSLEAFSHNLPLQLTRFIGREEEIATVKDLLQSVRLLTLTGAGGCGKTRLALQVAAELLPEYGEGVWFVELAALAEPGLVPQTVAAALGVREGVGAPAIGPRAAQHGRPLLAVLIDHLRPRSLLLVLDNCEHLLSGCADLAEGLLRGCPHVRILGTSRERLGIVGEQTYGVPSLSVPDPKHLPPWERLQEFEAVSLFADRARLSQPDFKVTEANAVAVAQVCYQLDGIPLALELAAARVKALPVEKLAERLDDRFRLLTGGSRAALPRHQTLRALIDWSYDLLTEPERVLLRRLSVFAGTWTLEPVEAVCGDDERPPTNDEHGEHTVVRHSSAVVRRDDVIDLLTSLVEKSLVGYETAGEGRYRLLETVRQYARGRLLEAGEAEAVQGRHRDWFLALAEQAEPELYGAEQVVWLDRLERELDNLRAALDWAAARGRTELGLRLATALQEFWELHHHLIEGWERLTSFLARLPSTERSLLRARALYGAGMLGSTLHHLAAARAYQEESLSIQEELGNRRGIAGALYGLGYVASHEGDLQAATAYHEQALAIRRELDDKPAMASSLNNLAHMSLMRRDGVAARRFYEESLGIWRGLGYEWGMHYSLHGLGDCAHVEGDLKAAKAFYEESLAIRRRIGNRLGIRKALGALGMIAEAEGEYETARQRYEESTAIARTLDKKAGLLVRFHDLVRLALKRGDREEARVLADEVRRMSQEAGDRLAIADSGNLLGEVALAEGDLAAARRCFEESRAALQDPRNRWLLARTYLGLGRVAQRQGDPATARSLFQEALVARCEIGKIEILEYLEALAAALGALGNGRRAAVLFGAAKASRDSFGTPLPPVDRPAYEGGLAAVRTALGEEAFAAAWAEGGAIPLEDAIALALEDRGATATMP